MIARACVGRREDSGSCDCSALGSPLLQQRKARRRHGSQLNLRLKIERGGLLTVAVRRVVAASSLGRVASTSVVAVVGPPASAGKEQDTNRLRHAQTFNRNCIIG